MTNVILAPNPDRIIESLTSMGHDFTTAVADIVDNSIEAGATEIVIYVRFEGKESAVRISDNGCGMTPGGMEEAMRFGTRRNYGPSDLGKFGLGLKTASLSQCRKFTVASRTNESAGIHALSWDMDHLKQAKEWEALRISENDLDKNISKPLLESAGTVVFWSQIKDLLDYKDPKSKWAKKCLLKMCRELEDYLAMVFHRFLKGEDGHGPVEIKLNGNAIQAWDPFVRNEQHTQKLSPIIMGPGSDAAEGQIRMTPFVLPHKDKFSTLEAFKKASGPESWNQQQGFYIYRAGRMVQSGGWCNVRTADEHTKLARIALDFPPSLDDAFNIDVAKMSIDLPASVKEDIANHLKQVIRLAQESYRHPAGKKAAGNTGVQKNKHDNGVRHPTVQNARKWTFNEIITLFRGVVRPDEETTLENIIQRARENTGEIL